MRQEFETLQDTLSRLYEEEDRYNAIITNGEMSEEEWKILMVEFKAEMSAYIEKRMTEGVDKLTAFKEFKDAKIPTSLRKYLNSRIPKDEQAYHRAVVHFLHDYEKGL